MQTIVEPFNFVFVFYAKTPVIDKLLISSTLTSLRNLIHFRFRGLSLTQLKNDFCILVAITIYRHLRINCFQLF